MLSGQAKEHTHTHTVSHYGSFARLRMLEGHASKGPAESIGDHGSDFEPTPSCLCQAPAASLRERHAPGTSPESAQAPGGELAQNRSD